MLSNNTPVAVGQHCYINHLYIDSWRHTLFAMINTAAQQFAEQVYHDYRHNPDLREYSVFTGFDKGLWLLGVATEIPCAIRKRCSALTLSSRKIERHHCRENIALIIANEIGKMPVTISARHCELMGC